MGGSHKHPRTQGRCPGSLEEKEKEDICLKTGVSASASPESPPSPGVSARRTPESPPLHRSLRTRLRPRLRHPRRCSLECSPESMPESRPESPATPESPPCQRRSLRPKWACASGTGLQPMYPLPRLPSIYKYALRSWLPIYRPPPPPRNLRHRID